MTSHLLDALPKGKILCDNAAWFFAGSIFLWAQTTRPGELLMGTPTERELLKLAIQDTEEILSVLKMTDLSSSEKAALVLNVFDYYKDQQDKKEKVAPENVIDFVKRAACRTG